MYQRSEFFVQELNKKIYNYKTTSICLLGFDLRVGRFTWGSAAQQKYDMSFNEMSLVPYTES